MEPEEWIRDRFEAAETRLERIEAKLDILMGHKAVITSEARSRSFWISSFVAGSIAVLSALAQRFYK